MDNRNTSGKQVKLKTTKSQSRSSQRYRTRGAQDANQVRRVTRHVLHNMRHAKKRGCYNDYGAHAFLLGLIGVNKDNELIRVAAIR